MKWAEFGVHKGVHHLASSWKSPTGTEWRYEPACHSKSKELREIDGDVYCVECLKAFCEALGS